jgi:hypothetical protein
MERYLWSAIAGRRLRSEISLGWRVVPTISHVGIFATVSRELSTKPLTVFRAGEQAERTKAEHAPDKSVHQTSFAHRPVKVPRVSKRANPKRVAS